jgi:hypothetical protein
VLYGGAQPPKPKGKKAEELEAARAAAVEEVGREFPLSALIEVEELIE